MDINFEMLNYQILRWIEDKHKKTLKKWAREYKKDAEAGAKSLGYNDLYLEGYEVEFGLTITLKKKSDIELT